MKASCARVGMICPRLHMLAGVAVVHAQSKLSGLGTGPVQGGPSPGLCGAGLAL